MNAGTHLDGGLPEGGGAARVAPGAAALTLQLTQLVDLPQRALRERLQ